MLIVCVVLIKIRKVRMMKMTLRSMRLKARSKKNLHEDQEDCNVLFEGDKL